ncbi:MAG: hypothetical protein F6K28_47145 [Microcoleus sp. SIO2G3]|nr:hypothetical protein [Microcoleus sp. SIO2G3]
MICLPSPPRHYVEEADAFLALFPHRFDFIYADHPQPDRKPNWHTESRYPLSDRQIQQGKSLYGVRFGSTTRYCLLDIDIASSYHPQQDPFAIGRIMAALEQIGLVSAIACTSSYSGGIHLYIPFASEQRSWQVAIALSGLLESAGFRLRAVQLELFPNRKPYATDSVPRLYQAHRLPLQVGSNLLNSDLQPIWSDRSSFVRQWQCAEQRNEVDTRLFDQLVQQNRQKRYRVSRRAEQFLQDLNTEINPGWTDSGQTNHLLGRIAMRSYIFHHVLSGGEPLIGQALIDNIVEMARSLPGFEQWCQHRHEIIDRASEWARCIENSPYYHYGLPKQPRAEDAAEGAVVQVDRREEKRMNWNRKQAEGAQTRIQNAMADLIAKNALPDTITARFQALTQYGISGSSLYRYRQFWHPACCEEQPVANPSGLVILKSSSESIDSPARSAS